MNTLNLGLKETSGKVRVETRAGCTLVFGNMSGPGIRTYGRDRQYGTADLAWYFGQNSSGPLVNPCVSQSQDNPRYRQNRDHQG